MLLLLLQKLFKKVFSRLLNSNWKLNYIDDHFINEQSHLSSINVIPSLFPLSEWENLLLFLCSRCLLTEYLQFYWFLGQNRALIFTCFILKHWVPVAAVWHVPLYLFRSTVTLHCFHWALIQSLLNFNSSAQLPTDRM